MACMVIQAWQFIVVGLAGWLNRQQQEVIEYLRTENRVLREQLKGKRIRFTDDQRRRLARKAKALGRKVLGEVCTLVTPEKAREGEKVAAAPLKAAQQAFGAIKRGHGLVAHAKGKWIGGADRGIAAAKAKLAKATTDAEREAAQKELAKWQKNREDGVAALKERQAALDKALREKPKLEKNLKDAENGLAQAKAQTLKTIKDMGLTALLSSNSLDAKLAKCVVLLEGTPRGLAEFAQQGKEQEQLVERLLADEDLMLQMVAADGAQAGRDGVGKYGQAMKIYTDIQQASRKADDGVFQRLALATSLEHAIPIPQKNREARPDAPAVVNPVSRYFHYERAFLAGELDPGFKDLSVWDLRMVVNGEEPDEILAWGRQMLRNYRPDQVVKPDFQAWIDFNGNGAFDHPSEEVYNGPLTDGQHSLPFVVPADAVPGYSFARFRISTAGELTPEGFAADGEVEDRHAYISRSDWGDAPDTYPTLAADNGASHDHTHIFLGNAADTEPDGLPHPRALGDDWDGTDDEDGVTFLTPVVPGSPVQVSVTATVPLTPNSGYLNAWVDFDRSGTWEADEQVFDGKPIPDGTSVLSFDVPPEAETGQTFARFRLSFARLNLGPSGRCPVGEVEDYEVEITPPPMDYGDAPDSYGTLARSDGARHVIGGPYLGQRGEVPDADPDGQPTPEALGDDLDADGNDESGVSWGYLYPGVQKEVVVDVGGGGGVFQAWVDFNNNGRFDLPEEEVFNEWLSEGRHQLGLTTPTSAEEHLAIARCRISMSGGLAPGGLALDGEVEDYHAMVRYLDWGDAPETYPTLAADGGASHDADHDFCLGDRLDEEPDGSPQARALGDDTDNTDDEDGVTFLSQVVAGDSAQVMVEVRIKDSPGPGVLDGWIDFNRNGVWEADEQILDSVYVYDGLAVFPFAVPPESEPGQSFSRFRLSTIVGLGPGGFGDTGEVEDHEVIILPPPLDFGDAPDSATTPGYPTLEAHNGARHIPGGPWLGASRDYPDEEPDGQPDLAAMGDNLDTDPANGGLNANDENGISGGPLIQAVPVTLQVTVNGGGGIVQAWVDFNGDSIWQDPAELIFQGYLPDGTRPISVTAPANAAVGPTFARFRISSAGGLTPEGLAADGEVEDHQITIEPQPAMDWGDARDSLAGGGYPTLWVNNGARHTIGGPFFGEPGDAPDDELDGQPDAAALGDNADTDPANPGPNRDDENGVTIPTLAQGASDFIEVTVGGGGGRVVAWIDFDGDRTWQASERIYSGLLSDGIHTIPVNVPAGAIEGRTFARFRISRQDTLGPTGWAPEGEVEDHEVWIAGDAPQVVGVFVRGTAWPTAFLNHLQATGQGNDALGYFIPVGSAAQLDPLPWSNLDQVSIVFSEPVNVTMADLHIYGVNVPSYSFAAHGYILPNTAVWRFRTPIGADKLLIDLSDSVTDAAGSALDGEWTDTVSSYPSGDGSAGGNFRFLLNVLPGDADNSGSVDHFDYLTCKSGCGSGVGDGGLVEADFDADGDVDRDDLQAIEGNFEKTVRQQVPVVPDAVSQRMIAGEPNPTGEGLVEQVPTSTEAQAGAPVEGVTSVVGPIVDDPTDSDAQESVPDSFALLQWAETQTQAVGTDDGGKTREDAGPQACALTATPTVTFPAPAPRTGLGASGPVPTAPSASLEPDADALASVIGSAAPENVEAVIADPMVTGLGEDQLTALSLPALELLDLPL